MFRLKRVSLLFLSVLCSIFVCIANEPMSEVDTLSTNRSIFEIEMEKGHISGILITKDYNDRIVGTMINEFGVSALSFIYDKNKDTIKLQDVMSMLNKWYIKRVLKSDLNYCIHVLYDIPYKSSKVHIISKKNDKTTVTNTKRKIAYSFQPISFEDNEITE